MTSGIPIDISNGTKPCPSCKRVLPLSGFPKSKATPSGLFAYCRECVYVRHKAWSKKNPGYSARKHREHRRKPENKERYKDYSTKKNFGLAAGSYAKMFTAQDGKCAICKRLDVGQKGRERFHIDHCHETNVIRGLLCRRCNLGLGYFKHNKTFLCEAAEYLNNYPTLLAEAAAKGR